MAQTRDKVFWDAFVSHTSRTVKAAHLLQQMLQTPARAEQLAEEISAIETEGDKITHDAIMALHKTWITPLDREEIHALISKLDDVLDYVEAAAERVLLYEIAVATPEAIDLVRVLVASAEALSRAITALHGFKDAKPVLDVCIEINALENEADKLLRRGLARLFRKPPVGKGPNPGPYQGGSVPPSDPLDVMKWRDIYEILETATDRAEDVANIIEGIVLAHA